MPCRYQPESLSNLSENRVVSDLVQTCNRIHELTTTHRRIGLTTTQPQTFAFVRNRIRPYWNTSVPTPVRRRLLNKCMDVLADAIREGTAADDVPLYLLNVMLNADIRELKVQLCCYYGCSHQTAMLKLLATGAARGLTSLELVRPTLLRLDTRLFQSVLFSMNNLKRLVLKNIACDKILKTIGYSCSRLEILDVSHSSQVTDNGIRNLLLQTEIKDKSSSQMQRATGKIQSTNRTTKSWWHNMKSLSKKLKLNSGGRRNKINDPPPFIVEYFQTPTELCSTLYTLNIANTSVTSHGILMALQNIPNLETLGPYCYIEKALELLDKCGAAMPSSTRLELKMANACRTTSARLRVLCNTCTKLNRLTIIEPLHSPLMLGQLPKSLTAINLQNVPADRAWLDGLYEFLSRPQSRVLRELFLKFRRDDTVSSSSSTVVDLSAFLPRLINLETLSIDGVETTLLRSDYNCANATTTVAKLERIQLNNVDGPNTIRRLLTCSPALKVFHVYTCTGLNGLDFVDLLLRPDENETTGPARKTPKHLSCVYINELPRGDVNTVKRIIDLCPEINKIGNVNNWDISREEIKDLNTWKHKNNLNLELHANAHWFCSECFPIL